MCSPHLVNTVKEVRFPSYRVCEPRKPPLLSEAQFLHLLNGKEYSLAHISKLLWNYKMMDGSALSKL